MPQVQMPDGTVVEMPEQVDPATAMRLRALLDGKKSASAINDVPTVEPAQQPPQVTEKTPSLWERVKGAGETALTLGTGAIAAPVGAAAGIVKDVLSGGYGTQEGLRQGEKTAAEVGQALTYQPRTATGKTYTEAAADALQKSGLAGVAPSEGLALGQAASAAKGVLAPAGRAIARTAGGALPERVQQAVRTVAQTPKALAGKMTGVSTNRLAQKAVSLGIPLRPDMLSDNKVLRMIGDALEKVPVAGGRGKERSVAFNRAVMKTIGADPKEERLTPEVFDQAITRSGSTIGDIAEKNQLHLTPEFENSLLERLGDAERFETPDVAKIVNSMVDELLNKEQNGVVDGMTFRKWNTKIGAKVRSTPNGDLRYALSELQDDALAAFRKDIPAGDLARFDEARAQYANAKTLEGLVAKSTTGDISPAGLLSQLTATREGKSLMARGMKGDLGDVARIGKKFVAEPATSGTAERELAYKAAGTLGAIGAGTVAPGVLPTAAGVWSAANLYNRLAPKLIQTAAGRRMLSQLRQQAEKESQGWQGIGVLSDQFSNQDSTGTQ